MQIIFSGDNLHETAEPIFSGKQRNKCISLSSAELAKTVVKVNISCRKNTVLLCLPIFRYCIFLYSFRIAKTFARKGSYSNPMVGMVTSEKVHKMDNTTTVVDGCVNEGLDTLKRRIDLFEAFQNLCKYSTPYNSSEKKK